MLKQRRMLTPAPTLNANGERRLMGKSIFPISSPVTSVSLTYFCVIFCRANMLHTFKLMLDSCAAGKTECFELFLCQPPVKSPSSHVVWNPSPPFPASALDLAKVLTKTG